MVRPPLGDKYLLLVMHQLGLSLLVDLLDVMELPGHSGIGSV